MDPLLAIIDPVIMGNNKSIITEIIGNNDFAILCNNDVITDVKMSNNPVITHIIMSNNGYIIAVIIGNSSQADSA